MSRRAVVAINAQYSDFKYFKNYINSETIIVGCDGGSNFLESVGIKPDVIIGDLDSLNNIPKSVLSKMDSAPFEIIDNGVKYVVYPTDKDKLDSELAIEYCLNEKVDEIVCYGILGDRLDHILGNVFLLTKLKYKNTKLKFVDQNQETYIGQGATTIKGSVGDLVSLIPIDGKAEVTKSDGFKYDPSKYEMSTESNLGISNELTKTEAKLEIKKGRFLVIHRKTKYQ